MNISHWVQVVLVKKINKNETMAMENLLSDQMHEISSIPRIFFLLQGLGASILSTY